MNKSAFLLIIAALLFLLSSGSVSATWWNESFSYKMPVNCTNLDDNVPLVINGSSGFEIDGKKQIVWTYCSGTGTALYYNNYSDYVIANDTTQLPFEVEFGNGTSYNPTSVWDSNFKDVELMEETSGNVIDSTSSGNSYTVHSATSTSNGFIGNAYHFDGTNDYLQDTSPTGFVTGAGARTMSLWVKPEVDDTQMSFYEYGSSDVAKKFGLGRWTANNGLVFLGYAADYEGSIIVPQSWTMLTIAYDGTDVKLYVNGTHDSDSAKTLNTVIDAGGVTIGAWWDGSNPIFDTTGTIDYVTFSNIERSHSFINQTYQNAIGTSGYGNLLAEESAPSGGAPTITAHVTSPAVVYTNTDFKFNMTATDDDNATFTGWV